MAHLLDVKCANVHLINDQFIPGGHLKIIIAPVESPGIIDNAIADRIGHLSGIRVDARQRTLWTVNDVSVFIPGFCLWHISRPVTVLLSGQRCGSLAPVVERSGQVNLVGMGCPYAKRCTIYARYGTHAWMLCRGIGHVPHHLPASIALRSSPRAGSVLRARLLIYGGPIQFVRDFPDGRSIRPYSERGVTEPSLPE